MKDRPRRRSVQNTLPRRRADWQLSNMVSTDGPLVTVVIPTWNRRQMVSEAVASVVAQTYQHWQLIVVDDGSTDDTISYLERFAVPNLQILRSPHIGHL